MPILNFSKHRSLISILQTLIKSIFFISITIIAIVLAKDTNAVDYTEPPVITDAEPSQDSFIPAIAVYIQSVNKTISINTASIFAGHISEAASAHKIDAALLLALVKIESRFNPNAASKHGALGFSQVIPRWHTEKIRQARRITGTHSMFDPKLNAYLGAWILSEYIGNFNSLDRGLLAYNGSLSDSTKSYARIVKAEARKIRDQFLNRSVLKL